MTVHKTDIGFAAVPAMYSVLILTDGSIEGEILLHAVFRIRRIQPDRIRQQNMGGRMIDSGERIRQFLSLAHSVHLVMVAEFPARFPVRADQGQIIALTDISGSRDFE